MDGTKEPTPQSPRQLPGDHQGTLFAEEAFLSVLFSDDICAALKYTVYSKCKTVWFLSGPHIPPLALSELSGGWSQPSKLKR